MKFFYSLQLFLSIVPCKRKASIKNKNNMCKYQAKALLCSVNTLFDHPVCFAGIVDTHLSFVQLRTKFVLNALNTDIFQECVGLSKLIRLSTMSHSKVNIEVLINSVEANALLDTGSSLNHLSYALCKMLKLDLDKSRCSVSLAINGYTLKGVGKCVAIVKLNNQNYDQVSFIVLKGLLTNV